MTERGVLGFQIGPMMCSVVFAASSISVEMVWFSHVSRLFQSQFDAKKESFPLLSPTVATDVRFFFFLSAFLKKHWL